MSRKFHGANCYKCPHFNIMNGFGEECESEKHTFCSVALKNHDKEIYNQALEDLAKKLKSKPYWDDEHNYQAIPIDYIDEVLEEITIK